MPRPRGGSWCAGGHVSQHSQFEVNSKFDCIPSRRHWRAPAGGDAARPPH